MTDATSITGTATIVVHTIAPAANGTSRPYTWASTTMCNPAGIVDASRNAAGRSMKGADSRSRKAGATSWRTTIAAPILGVSGGGNLKEPSSASSASVTPTAKKPSTGTHSTSARDASTNASGASAAGATSASATAASGGLRTKNARTRCGTVSPARVPVAAAIANEPMKNTG